MQGEITISDFQQLIRNRYFETDSKRGIAKSFLWLTEEFGELAYALGKCEQGNADMENLGEEFADVLAWLATIANIAEVDLTEAIHKKYLKDGGPEGVK